MKVLVLSPGEPSFVNSGLGVAADAINKELKNWIDLIIIQPENKSIDQITDEKSSRVVEVDKNLFAETSIIREQTNITVSSVLDPYHYATGTVRNKKVIRNIKKELLNYSNQVLKESALLDFDLVYAHDWITLQVAAKIKQKTGKPFVAHIHSLDYDRGATNYKSFVFDIELKALKKADVIISVSEYTAGILNKEYNIDFAKIKVIHNAVSHIKLPKVKKLVPEKLILFVGRLTGQKGPGIFMDIAEALVANRDDLRFVMVGGGELMTELIERGSNPLSSGKFHFTGNINYKDVLKLYSMADIYCMPSVSEPFGLSAIEAADCGLPMVISKQSGASEILDGALTADHWDVDQFCQNIDALLNDEKLAKDSIKKNKKAIASISWEKASKEILETFEKLT